jgi:glutaconate CoA-transferase subunit B
VQLQIGEGVVMSTYATDYTLTELMIVALAREMRDEEIGVQGAATPLGAAAVQLARLTHARNLMYYSVNGWSPQLYSLSELFDPALVSRTSICIPDLEDMVSAFQRGKVDFEIVRPAQIDKYGNMNNSVIGDHRKPKVRLPGAVGVPDTTRLIRRLMVYHPKQSKRSFVKKVDFVSSLGQLPGGINARTKLGIKGNGPSVVITNLAVLRFDTETGLMKLESIHPGSSMGHVLENTGFDLPRDKSVRLTEPPTGEQVELIRNKIDPQGLLKFEF